MKRQLLAAGFVIAGTLLSGCAANGAVVVRFAPPPPRYAVVGVAPGPGYVWTEGFYDYRGGNYVWSAGRWMHPPRPHAVWVPGSWSQGRRGYEFRRGYWGWGGGLWAGGGPGPPATRLPGCIFEVDTLNLIPWNEETQ